MRRQTTVPGGAGSIQRLGSYVPSGDGPAVADKGGARPFLKILKGAVPDNPEPCGKVPEPRTRHDGGLRRFFMGLAQ